MFEKEGLADAEVVGDLEIFTRLEETTGDAHIELSDASLPYGREVRVCFEDTMILHGIG